MIDLGPVLGLLILTIGCFVLRPCLLFWQQQRRLRLQGITVQGQVIERHQEVISNGQPWYYLTCRYNYEGQSYICDHPVWRILYEREEPFVAVRCLPGKPEQAIVLGDDFLRVEWMGRTIPGTVFFLIGAGMLCSFIPVLLTRHL
jgi:hypothetical protein